MRVFATRQLQTVRRTKTARSIQPAVEGCERRQLMSGVVAGVGGNTQVPAVVMAVSPATISGTVTNDLTGNGFSSDDTPLAGVTIQLFQQGHTAALASATTGTNGTYSFANLAPGNYSPREVVPSGWIETGGLGGYSITAASAQTVSQKNFDNFQLLANPSIHNVQYTVITPNGTSRHVSTLSGNIKPGDTVKATFNVPAPEVLTLVAYTARNGDFDTTNLQEQVIYSVQTTSGATGPQTLTVAVPTGYFQVDFVYGPAIDHLDTNGNVLYHSQDRYINGQQGGP